MKKPTPKEDDYTIKREWVNQPESAPEEKLYKMNPQEEFAYISKVAYDEAEVRYPVDRHSNPSDTPYREANKGFQYGVKFGVQWQKERKNEWQLALISITPGGSEFQTINECVKYIREDREMKHKMLAAAISKNKELYTKEELLLECERAYAIGMLNQREWDLDGLAVYIQGEGKERWELAKNFIESNLKIRA